jgi:inhibitor of cysteine peptidase
MPVQKRQLMWPGFALLLLLTSLVSGCNASNEIELGIDDSGSQVEVKKGQILVITLESNPTTGYRWEVLKINEAMLEQLGEPEFISSDSEGLVGVGGVEVLRLKAVGVGTTYLELGYLRFWEEDVAPLMLYNLSIVISE